LPQLNTGIATPPPQRVRRPTYRSLESHAAEDGRVLPTSTLGSLLNGPTVPRWQTVDSFVGACARNARAHRIRLDPTLVDEDRWHADYRTMENCVRSDEFSTPDKSLLP
jgi:hypothetical protein